jgi:hypothetical protein
MKLQDGRKCVRKYSVGEAGVGKAGVGKAEKLIG